MIAQLLYILWDRPYCWVSCFCFPILKTDHSLSFPSRGVRVHGVLHCSCHHWPLGQHLWLEKRDQNAHVWEYYPMTIILWRPNEWKWIFCLYKIDMFILCVCILCRHTKKSVQDLFLPKIVRKLEKKNITVNQNGLHIGAKMLSSVLWNHHKNISTWIIGKRLNISEGFVLLKYREWNQWILLSPYHNWPLCIWWCWPLFSSWPFFLPFYLSISSQISLLDFFPPFSKYLYHPGCCSWTCSQLYNHPNQHPSFSWDHQSAIIMKSVFPSSTCLPSSNLQDISSWLFTGICSPAFPNQTLCLHPLPLTVLLTFCISYVSEHFQLAIQGERVDNSLLFSFSFQHESVIIVSSLFTIIIV